MKKILLIAVAFLSFGVLANADTFTVYGSRAAQNPTDFIDWGQLGPPAYGVNISSNQAVLTFNGNTALAGNIDLSPFERADEGNGWLGSFDVGETLVWTGNAAQFGVGGEGPFGVALGTPVSSFGFSIQADLYGPFTATVNALDANGNVMFTDTFNGPCPGTDAGCNGSENGAALFIGIGDLTGPHIAAFTISTDSTGNPQCAPSCSGYANDFAIDDPSFTTNASTPEPGSIALLGSGLLGMAGVLRRKLWK